MVNEASTWKNQIIKVFERTKSAMAEYFVNWSYVSLEIMHSKYTYFVKEILIIFPRKIRMFGGGGGWLNGSELLRLQTGYVI